MEARRETVELRARNYADLMRRQIETRSDSAAMVSSSRHPANLHLADVKPGNIMFRE